MKKGNWIYKVLLGAVIVVGLLLAVSAFSFPGNIKFFSVRSGSMEPTIKTGAVILVKPALLYVIGDIITFVPATKTKPPTTHRIVEIKGEGSAIRYVVKGDANDAADLREISPGDVIGRVIADIPYIGYPVAIVQTKFGFIGLLLIPAVWIVFEEGKKICREVKRMHGEKTTRGNPYSDTEHT